MAIHPEKNDVDVSSLFRWGNKFEIKDRYGNHVTDAYIRLVGDAEINRARIFAIRKSAELRKVLKTEDSDERIAFISSVYDYDEKQDLIDMIAAVSIRDFAQEAARELQFPMPKEPKSDAKLEEIEKFQAEVDSYTDRRNAELNRLTFEIMDAYKASVQNMSLTDLKKTYEKKLINELCERRMLTVFKEVCVAYGSFIDEDYSKKMFDTYEEFENLPTEIKEQYIDAYSSLEINIDELKKLQEAMQ